MNSGFSPLVSIVIPVYNGSNFLAKAIESALAQTYPNIEVLVINDGSSDNGATENIALSYRDKIRYFYKPNGGVSSALNFGIEQMKGEYFSWLSHDDLYEPDKVTREVEALSDVSDRQDIIVCCADKLIDADGNPIFHPTKRLEGLYQGSELFDIFFRQHLIINGCTLLIHKSAFKRFGGFSSFKYIQDTECWINFMLGGLSFLFIPDKLVYMRVHSGQVTQRMPELFYVEMAQFSNRIVRDYIAQGKMRNSNVESFLIYHYKNRNSKISKSIEQVYGNVMPVRKYAYSLYGVMFDMARKIYSRFFKK